MSENVYMDLIKVKFLFRIKFKDHLNINLHNVFLKKTVFTFSISPFFSLYAVKVAKQKYLKSILFSIEC